MHNAKPILTNADTTAVCDILDYIRLNESVLTTPQMYAYFRDKDLLKELVYAFPFMVKGHVLAFETLLSKAVVRQAYIDRPELIDADIIESMQRARF